MQNKRCDIQGLRGWAIILVILFHFYPACFPNGYLGVDVFLVLSGFLVTMILRRSETLNLNTFGVFYYRRIKRIIPLYLLCIGCTTVAIHLILPTSYRKLNSTYARQAFLLTTNMQYSSEMEMDYQIMLSAAQNLFTHTWSLCLEMQWYLIVPFLFLLQRFITKLEKLFVLTATVASFLLFSVSNENMAFYNVFCRLWQFMGGALAFLLIHKSSGECEEKQGLVSSPNTREEERDGAPAENFSNALFVAFVLPLFLPYSNPHILRIHATVSTVLLLVNGDKCKTIFLSNPYMVYIGDISYVLYLIHWPVYIITNNFKLSIYGAYPIGILVSFVAAVIMCEYFEKVYLQWQPSSIALLLVLTIVTTACLVFRPPSSGYPFTDEPFRFKGVNLSDASWNHTLMQHIAYSEGVRVRALRRNFVTPGCKYSERFVGKNLIPFGLCQLKTSLDCAQNLHLNLKILPLMAMGPVVFFAARYTTVFSPAVVLACLLGEFGPSDTSRVPTRQEKMASSFASILRDAQCGSIEIEDEEGISVESEKEDPTWSVEEDDEENTNQQRGSFRFGKMEVSNEKPGRGNLSVLVIGNSFACNQADMVYKAFRRQSSSFHVFCLSACEVLSLSAPTICKVRVNYTEIVEQLRPNVVFILDRYISSKRVPKGDLADNLDVTLMQQVYNLMNIERLADKVFILQALPSCLRSCVTTALDFMVWKNKPLRDIGTNLIVVDDELARTHLDELRKMCTKCELIDYLPALVNEDGMYRGYDNETNLLYFDNNNHLTRFGKERVQPIFDEIASRFEL